MTHDDRQLLGMQVQLLEFNAEPAIELTGPRLQWILEDLFEGIGECIVKPFFEDSSSNEAWNVGETKKHLRKCLHREVRGSW